MWDRVSIAILILSLSQCAWAMENRNLFLAAEKGDLAGARAALDNGADMNWRGGSLGWIALHCASYSGYQEIVELLLDRGTVINYTNYSGQTPLHVACKHWKKKIVEILLRRGADSKIKDNKGKTALNYADEADCDSIVELLTQGQRKKSGKKILGRCTTIFEAIEDNKPKAVRYLLEDRVCINDADSYGRTPLQKAVQGGHSKIVKELLKHGAHVNIVNGLDYFTPLYHACWYGYHRIAKVLLEHGADIHYTYPKDGSTALHVASGNGYHRIVKLLLDYSANIHSTQINRRTPLHIASLNGHLKVMKLLLGRGAVINCADYWGETPLHLCSYNGKNESVKLLLEYGAALNHTNEDGKMALDIAKAKHHNIIIGLITDEIRKRKEDYQSLLCARLSAGDYDLTDLLAIQRK
jgi:ankyrin repeat protein